jgi:hypothetical protein
MVIVTPNDSLLIVYVNSLSESFTPSPLESFLSESNPKSISLPSNIPSSSVSAFNGSVLVLSISTLSGMPSLSVSDE